MTLEIDETSLLARVPGAATLGAVEAALAKRGLTLGAAAAAHAERAIADWLAKGAPGAASAFADPADHVVAGLTAVLTNGRRIEIHPSPRRSVGPDLVALVVGAQERFATVEHAWLRVHHAGVAPREAPLPKIDLDPPVSAEESALLDRIARALA